VNVRPMTTMMMNTKQPTAVLQGAKRELDSSAVAPCEMSSIDTHNLHLQGVANNNMSTVKHFSIFGEIKPIRFFVMWCVWYQEIFTSRSWNKFNNGIEQSITIIFEQ
jgi:hypothetical protein